MNRAMADTWRSNDCPEWTLLARLAGIEPATLGFGGQRFLPCGLALTLQLIDFSG